MKTGMMQKINLLMVLFFVLSFLFVAKGHAETFYVDNTTTGCYDGATDYDPVREACGGGSYRIYDHPQDAANVVDPGDVVIVKDGTYTDTNNDNYIVKVIRGGTSENWITFKAENKWGAVLDGQNYNALGGFEWFADNVNYVRIEGFEIKETYSAGIGVNNRTANYLQWYGNHIHHIGRVCDDSSTGHKGIFGSSTVSHVTIDSNLIHHIGRLHPSNGCSYSTTRYQQSDHGIYSYMQYIIIKNNIFYENKSGWSISLRGKPTNVINNIFHGANQFRGGIIAFDYHPQYDIIIQNNIAYANSGEDFILPYDPVYEGNVDIRYNLLFPGMNIIGDFYCNKAGRCYEDGMYNISNNKFDDPIFENVSTRDYHLKSTSPAIAAGYVPGAPAYDFDGKQRGNPVDIGAYEYASSYEPPPPPPVPDPDEVKVISIGNTWKYYKGYSVPVSGWNTVSFDDSSWFEGPSGIGYGDGDDATVIPDMQNNYITLYARRSFTVSDASAVTGMTFNIDYDDGFVAYLNGQEIARGSMPSGTPSFNTLATDHEAGTSVAFDLSSHISKLQDGENVLAVEVHNGGIGSSDLSFIPELSVASDGQIGIADAPAPPIGLKILIQ